MFSLAGDWKTDTRPHRCRGGQSTGHPGWGCSSVHWDTRCALCGAGKVEGHTRPRERKTGARKEHPPRFQNTREPRWPSLPTFEQAIRPFMHWQVLQSSSHLAPSGITLPIVMQGRPETDRWRPVSRSLFSCGTDQFSIPHSLPLMKRLQLCPLSREDGSTHKNRHMSFLLATPSLAM